MKRNRLASLLLALVMVLSVAPLAFAVDTADFAANSVEYLGIVQPEKPVFDFDPSVQLPMIMPTAFARWEATDTLGATGDSNYHGYAFVGPNQILQATLTCPKNSTLDYDLYLIEANPSTGALIGIIDRSDFGTYSNNGKTMDEKIGLVNTTSNTRAFVFAVVAGIGGSTGQYTLGYSISDTFDSFEWDGNPYYARSISAPGNTAVSFGNRTINTLDDDDWYVVNLQNSGNYSDIAFGLDTASRTDGYCVEIYRVLTGNRMELLGANTTIPNNKGFLYIRVYTTNTFSETRPYTLTLTPVFPPARISITSIVNSDGKVAPNVVYSSVSNVARPRVERSWTTVNGRVTDANGNGVSGIEVQLTWVSGGWAEGSSNSMRQGSATTDANGNYSAQVNLPPPVGARSQIIPGAITFTHYFDECLFDVWVNPDVTTDILAYQFAYSTSF